MLTFLVCAICYNDLGVKTPDGDIEVALRLPKCKHIFGDVCLKKWLEDSDSCPFCRDKLPSEPKRRKHHPRGLGAYTYGAYVAAMSQPYGSRRDPTLPDMVGDLRATIR